MNPFLDTVSPKVAIDQEDCQRIHYAAVRAAASGMRARSLPESVPLAALRERARLDGPGIYFLHPAEIERLFATVTLTIFRAVRFLYCSRLGRSIWMVWRILQAMANEASVAALSYEAVWALCLFLEKQRRESVSVPVERGQETWWIGLTMPDLVIREGTELAYQPVILWCIEAPDFRVRSFRIVPAGTGSEEGPLVLYDALVMARLPRARVATGLLWHLPRQLSTSFVLAPSCLAACQRGGIHIETSVAEPSVLQTIRETWESGVAGQTLSLRSCATLLDSYLYRVHGYGPLRELKQRAQASLPLIGYNQDPARQFPLLRAFLPQHQSMITAEGTVPLNGLHYTHELLSYWPGSPVTLRCSTYTEATAWIYLDGEILCQARAQELRRRDGSYRPFRH
jgi:hypothetical protein